MENPPQKISPSSSLVKISPPKRQYCRPAKFAVTSSRVELPLQGVPDDVEYATTRCCALSQRVLENDLVELPDDVY